MMKVAIAFLALIAVVYSRSAQDEHRMFADFKTTYGKTYSKVEESHKFHCFSKNLKLIDSHNAKGAETHGVNQFTDLCVEEFNKMYLGFKKSNHTANKFSVPFVPVTKAGDSNAVDWRTKGAVTPVKNQGQCGSCWSFSATGNMEGQWFLAGNQLTSLSEEELCQCSHNGNEGCNGGLMDLAFEWVVSNGGINTEMAYPYTSGDGITGSCNEEEKAVHVAMLTGHTDLPSDETQMGNWVMTGGPLSIAVDASSGWQSYTGGIMRNCFGTQLDHGVLAVGFDDAHSPPYWIVKNSWAASWGENGYIRLEKGTNQCGLNQDPSSSIAQK